TLTRQLLIVLLYQMLPYLLVLLIAPSLIRGREQTVGVRGTIICGSRPLPEADIKLWDADIGPDPDDLMATTRPDSGGRFQLWGTEDEYTNIDPVLRIYHNCSNKWPCKRVVKLSIPDAYVAQGDKVETWYNLGTINLETKFAYEDRECF
ncbi:hypothetical protein PMAYCL1PPCAC_18884, partial [Pristionchus mayeri]